MIKMVAYINDFLLLAHSREEAHLQGQLMVTMFQALGFSINTEKFLLTPCQELEFLGVTVQSQPPTLHLPQLKMKAIKDRAIQLLSRDASHQTIYVNGPIYWNSQCNSGGNPTCSSVLQIPSSNKIFLSESGGGDGQLSSSLEHRQGGAELVEGTSQFMECSQLVISSQLDKGNHRCVQLGLGSSLQGSDHRGAMVTAGDLLSHQLSRDAGSLPMLHKGDAFPLDSVPQYGQHDSNILLESQRGNNITLSVLVSQGNLGMVHVPGHYPESQSPTWAPQHCSRQGVQGESRQMGLEASPKHFSKNQPDLGTLCSRPVCIQTNTPITSVFQLEARPSSSSNGCLPPGKMCYANPPWGIMLKVLSEISHQQADVLIVAPV